MRLIFNIFRHMNCSTHAVKSVWKRLSLETLVLKCTSKHNRHYRVDTDKKFFG